MKNERLKLIILALGFALPCYYIMNHMLVTTTGSLKYRYFWKTDKIPEKGDYLMFCFNHPLISPDDLTVTKKIACTQGSLLTVKNRIFYCDGKPLGLAKTVSTRGDKLPVFNWNGVIPKGKLFLTGEHPDSFDSKYWGFFDLKETYQVVFPLAKGWL